MERRGEERLPRNVRGLFKSELWVEQNDRDQQQPATPAKRAKGRMNSGYRMQPSGVRQDLSLPFSTAGKHRSTVTKLHSMAKARAAKAAPKPHDRWAFPRRCFCQFFLNFAAIL